MKQLKFFLILILFIFLAQPIFAETLIEEGQSISIAINNIQEVIIENPEIIKVSTGPDNNLIVTGLKRGITYLYIWNAAQKKEVINIRVVPKGYNEEINLTEKLKRKQIVDSKSKINANILGGTTSNKYGVQAWNVEQLGFSSNTDLGNLSSFLQVERRDTVSSLVMAFLQLKNENYLFSVGDSWQSLSPLLGTYLKYQGAQVSNLKLQNINFDFLAGATGQKLWGNDIWRGPTDKKLFGGTKISMNINRDLKVYTNLFGVQRYNNNTALDTFLLASVGENYKFNAFSINSELAYGYQSKLSLFLEGIYSQNNITFSTQYKSIDKNFESLSDISQRDLHGFFNSLSFKLFDYFNLYGKYNTYRQPSLFDGNVAENGAGVSFFKDKLLPRVDLSYWQSARASLPKGSNYQGFQVYASQYLILLPSTFYVNYKPYTFDDPISPLSSRKLLRFGLNNEIFGLGYLTLEQTNESDTANTPSLLYTIRATTNPLLLLHDNSYQLFLYFDGKYERHYTSGAVDYINKYLQTNLKFKTEIFDEIYVNYEKNINSYTTKAEETEDKFSFGIKTIFDIDLQLMPKTWIVDGYFYEDLNKNGIRDSQEPVLPGFIVKNDNDKTISTDSGFYKIKVTNNPYIEFYSNQYSYYKICINNPYKVNLDPNNRHIGLDVPISFSREVTAIAFLDANKNGIYDEGYDQLIPNISILLEKDNDIKDKILNPTGEITFDVPKDSAGYSVTIDYNTVPEELFPEDIKLLKQAIPQGEKPIIYFPFVVK
ncbi:MAG: pilus assembly protein N-terminal domain-containing protein [Candidatus Margulisiibacteriota bacterium]|jgi:hypothetical protein